MHSAKSLFPVVNDVEKPAGASPEADDAGAVRRRHGEVVRPCGHAAVRPVRPAGAGAERQRGDHHAEDVREVPRRPLHCGDVLT